MRLLSIDIHDFRGARALELELSARVVAIRAANGRGKSSILQAIEWCLFGSEIEKKSSSGIAARVAWEVAFRGGGLPAVELRLDLSSDESSAHILHLRRAKTGARASDPEHFTLAEEFHRVEAERAPADLDGAPRQASLFDTPPPPASPVRESRSERREYVGEDAERRLDELEFPSWAEWRRAFCQHQEDPRQRVVDGASRSAVLASLLGLDAWTAMRARVDAFQPRKTLKRLDDIDARLSDVAQEGPSKAHEAEDAALRERLRARGVALDADAATLRARAAARVRATGLALAEGFEMPEAPAADAGEDFAAWARGFARDVVQAASRTGKHGARLERREAIRAGLAAVRDAIDQATRAQDAQRRWSEEHGEDAALRQAQTDAESAKAAAQERLRSIDARSALLREAQSYLRTRALEETDCPLCASPGQDELALRIDRELDADGGELRASATRAIEEAEARAREAARALQESARLRRAREDSASRRERASAQLAQLLGANPDEDVLARGEAALRELEASIRRGQQQLAALDKGLEAFRGEVETWKELGALAIAETRRAASEDASARREAREAYERALDRAVRFTVDLEQISRFAREEQARASEARLAEVQRAFGDYARAILSAGRPEHESRPMPFRFVQKGTASKISYDVVDESGASALAIANQATLSAIAHALLFARAEARAREGKPSFVVLDDPAQSLDPEHSRGLVAAIESVSAHCPVVVASPDGSLVDAIERMSRGRYRVHELARFDPALGVRLQGAET